MYTTLPFGWKASAFIYNSIGLVATSYIRSLGFPCTQYIDDRHAGQLRLHAHRKNQFSDFQLAEMACFIACSVLLSLGYFIGLKKMCARALDFYAGDRASDLGRVFTKEVLTSADGQFLLFRHTFGKTLRGKDTNIFKVKRCENPIVCPVGNINLYVNMCDLMAINLRDGYLFTVTDRKGLVTESPFMGSAVSNRLTLHLKSLNLYQGESAHSFRSGCAITLALLGVSQEDVARHVGWKSLATAEYYSQCSKVMDSGHTASTLAASTKSAEGSSPQAALLPQTF